MNESEMLERAKRDNVRILVSVDPDGAWTMVPISMDLINRVEPEVWGAEFARLHAYALDDLRRSQL